MSLILTLPLSNITRANIYKGSKGLYYYIEDDNACEDDKLFPVYYDIHFPLQWALNEKIVDTYHGEIVTGPPHCDNCKDYGYYNGVFIGYCLNCAEVFDYTRGNGMTNIGPGIELDETMVAFDLTDYKKENSMWNTYLKNINLDDIGDQKLYEDHEMYKDLPYLIKTKKEEEENSSNYDDQFPNEIEDYEDEYYEDECDEEERKYETLKDRYA